MTEDRESRLMELFCDARALPRGERARFVSSACGSASDLRDAVLALLHVREQHIDTARTARFAAATSGAATAGIDVVEALSDDVAGPGRLLAGRYRLGHALGAGGSGTVVRAVDALTGDQVAVKFVCARTESQERAILREAAALRHAQVPGVVPFLDEGDEGFWAYLVMEYVDGAPFPGRGVAQGDWTEVRPRACALLAALDALHLVGVHHRDLKPANVLVRDDGTVAVVDLGVAEDDTDSDRHLEARTIKGTLGYVAPERAAGQLATALTDLYSVGVMLADALARPGRRIDGVFHGRGAADLDDSVPEIGRALIRSLLDPDPTRRPKSAAAALQAIGHRSDSPSVQLPQLGGTAAIEAIVDAARAGCSIDIVGPPGTGRTHLLDRVHERLVALGFKVRRVGRAAADRRIGSRAIVLADDVDALDARVRRRLQALRRRAVVVRVTRRPGRRYVRTDALSVEALGDLVGGPDRIFRAREEAARLMWARTAGEVKRIAAEADEWRRRGLARWTGRLEVVPARMDRLRALAARPTLPRSRLARIGLRDRVAATLASAVSQMEAGRVSDALLSATRAAVDARCSSRSTVRYADTLRVLTKCALLAGTSGAIDVALYHAEMSPVGDPEVTGWTRVLRAAATWLRGNAARALAVLEPILGHGSAEYAREAWTVAVAAARSESAELRRATLRAAARWARRHADRDVRARLSAWVAWLRYDQLRFHAAAALHGRAARLTPNPRSRITYLSNSAIAALEIGNLSGATRIARDARDAASAVCDVVNAARSEWLLRQAAYRSQSTVEVDDELIESVACLEPSRVRGAIELGEAAIAWRAGSARRASELAESAERTFRSCGHAPLASLALGLRVVCGGASPAMLRADIERKADGESVPLGVRAQIAALAVSGGISESLSRTTIREVRQWADSASRPAERRELLAPTEILDRLRPAFAGEP